MEDFEASRLSDVSGQIIVQQTPAGLAAVGLPWVGLFGSCAVPWPPPGGFLEFGRILMQSRLCFVGPGLVHCRAAWGLLGSSGLVSGLP